MRRGATITHVVVGVVDGVGVDALAAAAAVAMAAPRARRPRPPRGTGTAGDDGCTARRRWDRCDVVSINGSRPFYVVVVVVVA